MILKNSQVDGGTPVVSGDVIIGIYEAGSNDPMICAFLRLSKYYLDIQKVLNFGGVGRNEVQKSKGVRTSLNSAGSSSKFKRSSIQDIVRPMP